MQISPFDPKSDRASSAAQRASSVKLLLIEDNPADVRLIEQALAEVDDTSFELVWANRVSAGLERLAQGDIDIILLDLWLPDSQGFDSIVKIHQQTSAIPIVVLTGVTDDLYLKAIQLGVQEYLLKDYVNANTLTRTIRYAIERHRLVIDLEQKMQALQSSEARFRRIIENNADGIVIVDEQGRVRFINPAAELLFGRPAETLVGEMFGFPVVAGENSEIDIVQNEGKALVAEIRAEETIWEGETVSLVSLRDITERKLAETALAEERNLLRTLIDNFPDRIFFKDTESRYLIANVAVANIVGAVSTEELIGKTDFDLYPTELATQYYTNEQEVIRSGDPMLDREEPIIDRDANEGVALTTHVPLQDSQGNIIGLVGISRDITERKLLEEQLRQSQKMEAVGKLAGGVAHDFNNLLTAITGYSELLLQRTLNDDDPLHKDIEQIKKASQRAASLTRQLLAFSRKQVLQPKLLNLNQIVADLEKMLHRLIGEDIDLVTLLAPELGLVKADPSQIEQVIMNLVINARDAMPQGGRLTIETKNTILDKSYVRRHVDVEPGPYVLLATSDTGHGMTPETRDRVFEPFFTTKEQGKGTGLGLATVHGIIKQSGGHIWVYSEPSQGTAFKIYLPQVKETDASVRSSPLMIPSAEGTEIILLVEDEDLVRDLAARILTRGGYRVLAATSGADALEVCQQHAGLINLLVTDVVMPGGMNGRELAQRLSSSQPDLKVLYMSGYTDDAILHHGILDSDVAFLEKPFTPDVLLLRVHEILYGSQEP